MGMYQIPQEMEHIDWLIDMADGEITPEIQEKIDALAKNFKDNLDPFVDWIRNLGADAKADKTEGQFISKRGKARENKEERLKQILIRALESFGKLKAYGNRWRVGIREASIQTITWVGEGEPPKKFTKTKIEVSLDGDKLRQLDNLGKLPPGFKSERSKWLQIN